jgi:hypothetical protein
MDKAQKANFWRARATSERWAKLVIVWASGIFVALGALCCLAALGAQKSLAPEHAAPDTVAAVVLLGPGAALAMFKSRVAAGILLALSTLAAALSAVLVVIVISGNQLEHVGFLTLVTLFWGALAALSWCALRATMALRDPRVPTPAPLGTTVVAAHK